MASTPVHFNRPPAGQCIRHSAADSSKHISHAFDRFVSGYTVAATSPSAATLNQQNPNHETTLEILNSKFGGLQQLLQSLKSDSVDIYDKFNLPSALELLKSKMQILQNENLQTRQIEESTQISLFLNFLELTALQKDVEELKSTVANTVSLKTLTQEAIRMHMLNEKKIETIASKLQVDCANSLFVDIQSKDLTTPLPGFHSSALILTSTTNNEDS